MRRGFPVLVLIALLGLAFPAAAHDHRYPTRVTIRTPDQTVYKGRVFSGIHPCEAHRKVKLYLANGDYLGFSDTTDPEGRWEIDTGPGTQYYARATRKVIERNGHRHVCLPDNSPTI